MAIKRIKQLLTNSTSIDKCPECGDISPVGASRCPDCIGDFEDGGEIY